MPQPPFQTDAIQIEPGSGDVLLIERDATDGSMLFTDAQLTDVRLSDLTSLRSIEGVFVVGRAGSGAEYTTVQEAFDAIPDSSSSAAPSVVLVMPGVYSEVLTLQKDGVHVWAPGGATFENSGDNHTLVVSASQDVTPRSLSFRNIHFKNDQANRTALRIVGADTFATGTVEPTAAPLVAGDTLTIGGVVLTGVGATRTPGNNDFSVLGGTPDTIAAEISAAINDSLNSFTSLVTAAPVGAVVTLTAVTAGSPGNAITLATSTGDITLSGANLAGGSADGNFVGFEGIDVRDCDFEVTDPTGYQIYLDTINNFSLQGGSFVKSTGSTVVAVINCSVVDFRGVERMLDLEFSYDTGLDEPVLEGGVYTLTDIGGASSPSLLSNLNGNGSLSAWGCDFGTLGLDGDRSHLFIRCSCAAVTASGTGSVLFSETRRGAGVVGGGSVVSYDSTLVGSLVFAASASESFTFDLPQTDANYTVALESPTTAAVLAVTNKASTGFDVEASAPITGTVRFLIRR